MQAPYYFRDLERDPNFENYPFGVSGLREPLVWGDLLVGDVHGRLTGLVSLKTVGEFRV